MVWGLRLLVWLWLCLLACPSWQQGASGRARLPL